MANLTVEKGSLWKTSIKERVGQELIVRVISDSRNGKDSNEHETVMAVRYVGGLHDGTQSSITLFLFHFFERIEY